MGYWPLVGGCLVGVRRGVAFGEDLASGEGRVQGAGEAAVDGGMEDRLGDLLTGQADVERGADVDLELGLAAAEGGQGTDGHELAAG